MALEISSVPVFDGDHLIGVFGQVSDLVEAPHEHVELHLTPRQAEVLALLERGRTTKQIADDVTGGSSACSSHRASQRLPVPHPALPVRERDQGAHLERFAEVRVADTAGALLGHE